MKKEEYQATLTFLSRIDLKGNEVPAFNQVVQALNIEMAKAEPIKKEEKEELPEIKPVKKK